MGLAQRNRTSDGASCGLQSSVIRTTIQSFDGIKAIQVHLNHLDRLKEYLCAETKEMPDIPLTCHAECLIARWMHGEDVKECANKKLIESVCERCHEFHELATQSVLFTTMDVSEPVADVIQSAIDLENASNCFQRALADLHIECKLNQ